MHEGMNQGPGVFISFEGCDGSGKSTQIARLADKLESLGMRPLVTREPGGTPFGEKVRDLLLGLESPNRTILSELFLYAAARSEFVAKVVRPALSLGRIVLTERYTDSTLVYQGYAGGVSLQTIEMINAVATGDLEPDLTLVFDINNPHILEERFARKVKDKIESRSGEYHEKVREGYRELARRFSHRIVVIDACQCLSKVESAVWEQMVGTLAKKGYDSIKKRN